MPSTEHQISYQNFVISSSRHAKGLLWLIPGLYTVKHIYILLYILFKFIVSIFVLFAGLCSVTIAGEWLETRMRVVVQTKCKFIASTKVLTWNISTEQDAVKWRQKMCKNLQHSTHSHYLRQWCQKLYPSWFDSQKLTTLVWHVTLHLCWSTPQYHTGAGRVVQTRDLRRPGLTIAASSHQGAVILWYILVKLTFITKSKQIFYSNMYFCFLTIFILPTKLHNT